MIPGRIGLLGSHNSFWRNLPYHGVAITSVSIRAGKL
jgi:hypothetical protein